MTVAYISTADDLIQEIECEGDEVDDWCPSGWKIVQRIIEPSGEITVIIEPDRT
jgi:hypothetical protein